MNAKRLSQLVTGRSHKYVRTTIVLLTVMLAVAGIVAIFAQDRYQQLDHDFAKNDRLHTIRIRSRIEDGHPGRLTPDDDRRVRAIVGVRLRPANFDVVDRYELGGGLPVATGGPAYTVFGFGGNRSPRTLRSLVGIDPSVSPGTAFVLNGRAGSLTLTVPVVHAEEDGYTSDARVPITLNVSPTLDANRARYLFGSSDFHPIVVDFTTFQRLATTSLGGDWDSVVRRYQAGELPLTPLIGAQYVRVDRLDDVATAAHQLQTAGYDVDYALEAFDNLSGTLRVTVALGSVIVAIVAAAAVIALATAWNTYFTLSRRDIGMLRHFGFDERLVRAVYARRLTRGCLIATATAAAVVTLSAVGLMGNNAFGWLVIDLGAMIVLVAAIRTALLEIVLRRHVRSNPLELLKIDRQFQ